MPPDDGLATSTAAPADGGTPPVTSSGSTVASQTSSSANPPAVTPPAGPISEPPPVDWSKLATPDTLENDAKLVESLAGLGAEQKLPLEVVQKIVEAIGQHTEAKLAASQTVLEQENTAWLAAINADPEIGGAPGLAKIPEVLKSHGTPELEGWLRETGLINHPLLARFMAKVGKELGESPTLPMGAAAGPASKEAQLRSWYSNSPGMFN